MLCFLGQTFDQLIQFRAVHLAVAGDAAVDQLGLQHLRQCWVLLAQKADVTEHHLLLGDFVDHCRTLHVEGGVGVDQSGIMLFELGHELCSTLDDVLHFVNFVRREMAHDVVPSKLW